MEDSNFVLGSQSDIKPNTIMGIKEYLANKGIKISYGTISNILSGKANAKADKIKIVNDAAEEVGYVKNAHAQSLGTGRNNLVAVILPSLNCDVYRQFYLTLSRILTHANLSVNLHLTNDSQAKEKRILNKLSGKALKAVVGISCMSDMRDYEQINKNDCRIIFVERNISKAYHSFVGFDFEQIGKDANAKFEEEKYKNIVVVCDHPELIHISNIRSGLKENSTIEYIIMPTNYLNVDLRMLALAITLNEKLSKSKKKTRLSNSLQPSELTKILELMELTKIPDAIFFTNSYHHKVFLSMMKLLKMDETKIKLLIISAEGRIPDANVFSLNIQKAASTTADMILNDEFQVEKKIIPFIRNNKKNTLKKDVRLKILTITLESSDQLALFSSVIEKRLGIDIDVEHYDYDQFNKYVKSSSIDFDLIRMDVSMFPFYGPQILQQMDLSRSHYIDELKDDFFNVDGKQYGIPFNPSVNMIMYRKDLFENTLYSRLYLEANNGEPLKSPQNYEQFNRIARFFTKSINPDLNCSLVDYGTTNKLKGYHTNANQYQSRLLDLKEDYFDYDKKLNLVSDKSVRALENYLESFNYSPDLLISADIRKNAEQYSAGKIALTSSFSSYITHTFDIGDSTYSNTGYALCPGGILGGGVLGISKNCENKEAAILLLDMMTSEEFSLFLFKLGILVPTKFLFSNNDLLADYPFLPVVKESFSRSISRRIINPATGKDLNVLIFERKIGEAIYDEVICGKKSAREALEKAQTVIEKMINEGFI